MKLRLIHKIIIFFWTSIVFAQQEESRQEIYVSSISWHTGIVVPAYIFPEDVWHKKHDYSTASYLEVGWGEADFYPHDRFNIWYALKSIFWPTPSVVHINPIPENVEAYYGNKQVVKLKLGEEELEGLRQFLLDSLELDEDGKVIPAARGKHFDSYFYRARETYYFPKNSNVWVARALKEAGFSITPIIHQTTGSVVKKAARLQ